MRSWTSLGLLSIAVTLGAIALVDYRKSGHHSDEPRFTVLNADQDIGQRSVNEVLELSYQITNRGAGTIRIVGSEGGGCGTSCCFGPKMTEELNSNPITILSGETFDFVCDLVVRQVGSIKWDMVLFIEENGELYSVPIAVHGIGIPAKEKAKTIQ
jgi:hypothetical protein